MRGPTRRTDDKGDRGPISLALAHTCLLLLFMVCRRWRCSSY